jgi:hypothetical protein
MTLWPQLRLAHVPHTSASNVLVGKFGSNRLAADLQPSLLMSFHYLRKANNVGYINDLSMRSWVLDCGAFSAMNSGVDIDLADYIAFCKDILAGPRPPEEVFALDVIGDELATARNTEAMWEAGIEAIPTFHIGSSTQALLDMARDYPKIAIGGVARQAKQAKLDFAKQVFAHVWPKKVHGLGYAQLFHMLALPFHSGDASTWELGPCAFATWKSFGGKTVPIRGSAKDLTGEVRWYLDVERKLQARWKTMMALLD